MPSPIHTAATRVARSRSGHIWGEVWRFGIALLFGLALWGITATAAEQDGSEPQPLDVGFGMSGRTWVWWDLALGVLACLLLLRRRRWPLAIAVVTAAVNTVSLTASGASAIALISLATTRRWRAIAVALSVSLLERWVSFLWFRPVDRGPYWTEIALSLLAIGFCIATGFYIGERRAFVASLQERALTAEREQSMRVAQARVGERSRIAREMHDVLAHRISLVAMHSGALTYRTDLSPEEVATAAEVIRSNANLALAELRGVLGVLRDVGDEVSADGAPEPPQPTLHELDDMIDESGVDVELTVDGDLSTVPDALSRSAFRIVQECLTNARKHAPGEHVDLRLHVADRSDELRIDVRNHAPSQEGPRIEGAGLGLLGLTERAVLSGGELTYGPDRRGDFVVTARLPWTR